MSDGKNIAVIGLDDFHRQLLEDVRGADNYCFHGLIPYHHIVNPDRYPIEEFLHSAQRELSEIEGGVDAIIGHWDFPTTSLLPLLQAQLGLNGPSLESVLLCENKYATRLVGEEIIPELLPPFALVDPRDDAVADDPPLPYPFWLKPVVAFSSTLGFRVDGREDLKHALQQIRAGIDKFAAPFNTLMQRAHLGQRRALLNGKFCIAEGIISGRGTTVEGYVLDGEPQTYAIIDSLRGPNQVSFVGYHYPSDLPEEVGQRMEEASCRIVRHLGLRHTPFNIEFLWDEELDKLRILEINPRISKSHSPLFALVDGASHHEVAIDVALGREPRFRRGAGRWRYAAKFMPRVYAPARVTRAPTDDDLARLRQRFPDALFFSHVHEGMELSDLPNQDSYSFELGDLFLGGNSREELTRHFHEAMQILGFRFSQRVATNYE
ncbi:Biotin carboxylase [Vreelandella subterranea]|uniref:Biotin carboxylase n=1 Tax=Vreelandella subterranea TaxID=416874 RepID=A0A1H9QV56_9GAMM|nr:ATP-grasp domain-containing protein [Halomonas subterranea]SER64352.1 Biotin carboxylase [Halomonas subterranea]